MNQRKRFIRKIVYACVIAVLLLPLAWLSQPQTTESKGGQLAQLRSRYQLGQAQLGDIDPASETIKLATLGMRGVAANLLWTKANRYHKNEDWVNLSATLEQIAKLQPNFVSVWIFQGWNLSYNISVEFDDYRDRYHWVIRGIDFLKEGTQYNRNDPRLPSKIGHTIAHKIGRADEHVQYRELFRDDDDFNGSLPRAQRDNWLVGRDWHLKAEDLVARGEAIRGEAPLLFYSHPAFCLVNYAETLEAEGTFGEVAKNAWRNAASAWDELANRDLPTQYNFFIRLADKEALEERAQQARAELERLTPGLREQIIAEKIAALPEEDRAVVEMPEGERTVEQQKQLGTIVAKLQTVHLEVASRVEGENRAAALAAAETATDAEEMANYIDIQRGIVNYDYWRNRCEIEPQDDTLEARKLIYDADQAFSSAQLLAAAEKYGAGLQKWRGVLDTRPTLLADSNLIDELYAATERYRHALGQLDQPFPEPYVLQDVLDVFWRVNNVKGKGESSENPAAENAGSEAAESDPAAADKAEARAADPSNEASP